MKKLKCESCGGSIDVEENNEFATCPFCKTKYKLNETKSIYIRLDDNAKEILQTHMKQTSKISKFIFLPFAVVFIFIFIIIFIDIFKESRSTNQRLNSNTQNNHIEQTEENIKNIRDSINKNSFNWYFDSYSGSRYKPNVEIVLDNVVKNNKTNKELLVTVVYKDKETTDPDTIIEIKHLLKDRNKYEVKIDYDEYGYVNKVTIEDL